MMRVVMMLEASALRDDACRGCKTRLQAENLQNYFAGVKLTLRGQACLTKPKLLAPPRGSFLVGLYIALACFVSAK